MNEANKKSNQNRYLQFAPVTFSEERGIRFLHFGTPWIQGAMRISKPNELVLKYAQQMMAWLLFVDQPKNITQLGLGSASLTKFAYHVLKLPEVKVVEINEEVIAAAHTMFELNKVDDRLNIIQCDAWEYVQDAQQHGQVDILQIDLYDARAEGPVLDSLAFYRAARACLSEAGILIVNLFGYHSSYQKNMNRLNKAFDHRVIALPEIHDGNRIAFAFVGPKRTIEMEALVQRAQYIKKNYRLPAISWLNEFKKITEINPFVI